MTARSRWTLTPIAATLLALGACGGSDTKDAAPDLGAAAAGLEETRDIDRLVQIDLHTYQFADGQDWQELLGRVSRFDTPLSEVETLTSVVGAPYWGFGSQAECLTFEEADIVAYEEREDGGRDVRADEIVTVTGAGGSLGELYLRGHDGEDGRSARFLDDGRLDGPLSVSITGGLLPDYTDVALPRVAPFDALEVVGPSGSSGASGKRFGADSRISWRVADDETSLVRIAALDVRRADAAGNPSSVRGVLCTAPDDGAFEFSPETRAWMGPDFAGALGWSITRIAWTIERDGDTALLLTRSVLGDADTLD